MKIVDFSVKNSLLVNLASIFIVALGWISFMNLPREMFPQVNYDEVTITTVYPGALAEDVEKLVTNPIEKEIKGVTGIKEFTSKSNEGLSEIAIELDPTVKDKRKVVDDIEREVDRVNNLPEEVEDPEVFELESTEIPVLEVYLGGELTDHEIRQYAEILENRLEDVKGVSSVYRKSWRDREFHVETDPTLLDKKHVSMSEIVSALNQRNITVPAGKITQNNLDFNVRTTAEFRTAEEIGDVIVRSNDTGQHVKVKDIAVVVDTFEDENYRNKINGKRALGMMIQKKEWADSIDVVDDVREVIRQFKTEISENLEIETANDFSYYVRRRLGVLKNNVTIGFILVLIILFLFLDPLPALMTAVGIPIAVFTTFIFMDVFGISINLISMLGMIIVLGMLVDDGIIVSENVYRYIEKGYKPKEAAVKGAGEVLIPVTVTILTTYAAFFPLMIMDDIIGKFVRVIPQVVMIALAASWFESFIILPSHLADFVGLFGLKKHQAKEKKKGVFFYLQKFYKNILNISLNLRYLVLLGLVMSLVFAGWLFKTQMKMVLFSSEGIEEFSIRAEAPQGISIDKMDELLGPVEELVSQLPEAELASYQTFIGSIAENGFDPNAKRGTHLANIYVYLTPLVERTRSAQEITQSIRDELKNITGFEKVYLHIPKSGPPTGAPVEVGIKGEDFDILNTVAAKFIAELETMDGVYDITSTYDDGRKQFKVNIDELKARQFGLSVNQIALTVQEAFKGRLATSVKPLKAEEEIDVLVRFQKDFRNEEAFKKLTVQNNRGLLIPLSSVATIEEESGIYQINHTDGDRIVYVQAQLDEEKITPIEVKTHLQQKLANATDDLVGYDVVYSGEVEDQAETFRNLAISFIFALFLIFIILVAMFRSLIQPFIVMVAIPFGMVGVIIAFYLHGRPLSFLAMMGLVGLTGIVVNDSIVLVDFINRLRKENGHSRRESIIEGGLVRLRPVIMTTVTTIGGLVSVAYGIGGGDPFLIPMALAIVWGLFFGTFLTLLGIPCLYAIIDDITCFFSRKKNVSQKEKFT